MGGGRGWAWQWGPHRAGLRAGQDRQCDQTLCQFLTIFPPPGLQAGRAGAVARGGVTRTFKSDAIPFAQQEDGCVRVFSTKDAKRIGRVPHN